MVVIDKSRKLENAVILLLSAPLHKFPLQVQICSTGSPRKNWCG